MPDYSRIHEMVSHRVCIEYDTGARIVGYLASCQPGSGPVQFVKLTHAELIDSTGRVVQEGDITVCPNLVTSFRTEEGPRGRDRR